MKARVNTKSPRLSPLGGGPAEETSLDPTRKIDVSPPVKKTTILDYRTLSMMAKQNKSPMGSDRREHLLLNVGSRSILDVDEAY